jgi:toxin ParE1/3/4
MRVRYTAKANRDLDEVLSYIKADNPEAAVAVGVAITATVSRLLSFPYLGATTDQPEVRVVMARPYRYLIFYRADHDVIVIRNIRHPARRHPS